MLNHIIHVGKPAVLMRSADATGQQECVVNLIRQETRAVAMLKNKAVALSHLTTVIRMEDLITDTVLAFAGITDTLVKANDRSKLNAPSISHTWR
jgi:hypothetical protein